MRREVRRVFLQIQRSRSAARETAGAGLRVVGRLHAHDEPTDGPHGHLLIRLVGPRSVRRLFVEGLPIAHAASDELWPLRHNRQRIRPFRKNSPERRMVPAEFMAAAVAVLTDALYEAFLLA